MLTFMEMNMPVLQLSRYYQNWLKNIYISYLSNIGIKYTGN